MTIHLDDPAMLRSPERLPMYYRVESDLRKRIEAGEWKPGDLFPPERELVERYGISRMTVRQSLSGLVAEGLLHRVRGKGTFVAAPKIHKQLSSLLSFTEDMNRRGKRAGARVLSVEMAPLPAAAADSFGIEAARPVVVIERLRLADGEPIGIEWSHLVFTGAEALLEADMSGSLYLLLRDEHGVVPARADERIEAAACPKQAAELLGTSAGSPVLLITRTTYAPSGHPFELVQSVYRGDRYVFHVNLAPHEEFAEGSDAAFGFSA
ncbi:MAG TPA: GntR family transcriptional regulator [Chloroflexota bacterium]